jgi:hypothetical protein
MKVIDLPLRFIFALFAFTFRGWIGWLGIVLGALKLFGVIGWPWLVAALPLEYGVLYCLYMTIDGALYRAGHKGLGGYAHFTTSDQNLERTELDRIERELEQIRQLHSNDSQARLKAVRELNEGNKVSERVKQELSYYSLLMSMHIQGRHTKPLNDCALCRERNES